ncbi:MAG: DUF2285 domain-containing protein [Rhodobacteraceae bacterium]|nr:DUF2285 domain-containing protein [Paracoccaceae bacterium]
MRKTFACIGESQLLGDCSHGDVRHVVLSRGVHRYRLQLSDPPQHSVYPVFPLMADPLFAMRVLALAGLNKAEPAFYPTAYRRHRFCLLLRILDLVEANADRPPSLRTIAAKAVFPGRNFGPAIEWKSSSHRRQTQRLVASARHMAQSGYRRLLLGDPKGG